MSCKHKPIAPGTQFGRLTSTSETITKGKGEYYYKCNCVCNSEPRFYSTNKLITAHTRSCGCLRKDMRKLEGRLNLIKKGAVISDKEMQWITKIQKELE